MYDMFIKRDCTLLEVNPLAETTDGRVLACDAKLNFDDNAAFRQKDIFKNRDYSQVSDATLYICMHIMLAIYDRSI